MSHSALGTTEQQPQLLDQLLAIGQTIQQDITQNPKRAYQLIVETTCRLSGADCAILYPYHPSFGEFYDRENVAAYGLRYESQLEKRVDKVKGLAARVHQAGEIIREDIEREDPQIPLTSPFIAREGIKAFMGLSLKFGDDTVGLLYVDFRKPHRFSEEEKRLIRLLGQQAALAVSNSWTYRLASIRAEAVVRLKTIGQTLATIKDPSQALESVLDGIAHSARLVLDADLVDLYQYNQARGEFTLPPTSAGEKRYPQVSKLKIYDDDVAMEAVTKREPQYFQNSQETPWLIRTYGVAREDIPSQRFVIRERIVSSVAIPLIAAGETVGVMFVNYRAPQLFDAAQRDLIESFAAQAAVAIHNARLFQKEQVQRRQSETLRQVAQLVNSALERNEVIGLVLDQLGQVIEYSSASVQLIQGDHRFLVGGRGFLLEDSPRQLQRDVSQDALVSKIVREQRPVVLSDITDEPLWDHIPQTAHIHSWIGVPLIVREQVIGLLTVDHDTPGYYTQESGEVVAAFANQVATAIHNAELFALEQRRNREFQTLHQAATKLAEQPALPEIYQTAVQSTLEALQCRHSTIFILDRKTGELAAMARVGQLPAAPEVRRFKLGEGLAGLVVETGQSILENDAASNERFIEGGVMPRSAPRSIILAPIKIEDKIIGVISADKDEIGGFTEHNQKILEMLALDVGIAINLRRQMRQIGDQAQALAELNKLAQQLVSIEETPQEDTRKLLKQVAQSARQVLQADLIELYEYRQDRKEYRLPPVSAGERREPSVPKNKIYEDDVVFQLIHRKSPLYAENVRIDPILTAPYTIERPDHSVERFVIREGVRSTAAIPLRTGSEVVGLMFASYRQPQTFSTGQRELIELFANQAAIAIRNSRLFSETLRRRNDLQVVDEVSKLLMSTLDPVEIPRLLLQQIVHLFRVAGASLWQVDRAEQKVQCLFSLNHKGEEESFMNVLKGIPFELGRGIVGTVAESGKPLMVNQVQVEPRWDRRVDEATGFATRAILAVPLIHKQETVGVIEILNRLDQTPFTEEDQTFLTALVAPAAIALENARLYQHLERRVEALGALNEVGQQLTSGLRLKEDEILSLIYRQVRDLAHTQNVNIALYDEKTNTLTFKLVMERGRRVDIEQEKRFASRQIDKATVGKTEEIVLTGRAILHKTREETAGWYQKPGHRPYTTGDISASHLAVPMILGQKVKGVITIYDWDQEYAYDEQDKQVLSVIAGQAAIALENTHLFYDVNQKLERQVQALSALNEVGQTLTSGLRLKEEEILELIYEQARKLTGTQDMYIALYDETTQMIQFKLAMEKGERVAIAPPRQVNMERKGKTEEVIFTKQPLLHRTEHESEDWYKLPGHQEFVGRVQPSYLGVPMIVGEKVLGVIAVYDWEREHAYDKLHLQVLSSMANQAAIALDNARLYYDVNQKLERQVQALGILNEVGQTLTSGIRLTQDEILELIYKQVQHLTDAQDMYIALYDESTQTIRFSLATKEGQRVKIESRQANMEQRGKTEEVIFNRQPLLHKTKEESEGWYKLPGRQEFVGYVAPSWLGVPMIVGERVLGMIAVWDQKREYAYDELHLQVLSSMANQAAIALDNASLYAAAREEVIATKQLATLGTVMAAIQHRINNTLNIIGPNITRLRRRVDTSDETIREILDIIERNVRYTSDYIHRIQEPLKETDVQKVDINASLYDARSRVWQEYESRIGFGPVEVIEKLDDALPLLEASAAQITEIFRNLIENSYKAMGANGGVLTITSRQVDDWLEVEIQDTGPGIPAQINERLFIRPVPSRQPGGNGPGAGLGLWLSALLLQRYGGEIKVVETGSTGTTMLVRLPALNV